MGNSTTENGGLDWGEFRALEYFAIVYDIAIDEEHYNPKWCRLEPPQGFKSFVEQENNKGADKPWASHRYQLFPDSKSPGDLPDVGPITAGLNASESPYSRFLDPPEKLTNGKLILPAPESQSKNSTSSLWRKLLLAKYVRAKLQKDGSTPALDALDKLGLALLRAMPLTECGGEWDQQDRLQIQTLILKILFLNEAAACYQGYQSIALADDCLNLIKEVSKKITEDASREEGETPYELVALYNKAQGCLHIRDYVKALRLFKEAAHDDRTISVQERGHYFDCERPKYAHLRWLAQKRLFDAYVGYPSVLQSAETLLNLQRSWEAKERLCERNAAAPGLPTAYQRARVYILRERIKNDRGPEESASDGCLESVTWAEDAVKKNICNLAFQQLSVDSERSLANCRFKTADAVRAARDSKLSDAKKAVNASLADFETATKKLRERMKRATRNRSEIDEACLSWADGLSVCKELLSFAFSKEAADNYRAQVRKRVNAYFNLHTDVLVFHKVVRSLCTDEKYRDHADEIRKTLIKNLSKIHGLSVSEVEHGRKPPNEFQFLIQKIAKYLRDLLDDLIKKPPRSVESKIEIRGWKEQKTLLDGNPLPQEKLSEKEEEEEEEGGHDPATRRHEELRAFVSHEFVHSMEHDESLNPVKEKTGLPRWKDCQDGYRCVEKGGEPKEECGKKVLASNPSFTLAENGSETVHHLDRLVQKNREEINERLYTKRKHDPGWHFVVLQRWNSFTPAMRASEGGGYFLFHAGKHDNGENDPDFIDVGVVIDPGYGFVKNFFSEGFGVCDITAIVITHDHPDHLADVGSLVNLLLEVRKNRGGTARKNPKVELLLSRGAFERLLPLIESAREIFRDTVVLEPKLEYKVGEDKLVLRACPALHRDASDLPHHGGFDSVGLIAEIRDGSESKLQIGIPSDTKWDMQISQEYSPCDLICLHLGSIMPEKFPLISYFDKMKTSRKVLHEKQQLYLPGVVWYLEELLRKDRKNGMPTMVLLSEFGEELAGGVRIDIAERLQAYTKEKSPGKVVVLPGDVGLRVTPSRHGILCSCCHLEQLWTTPFHCETSGAEEQIFYVCPWCLRNFTQPERAKIFSGHHTRPVVEIRS